MAVLVEIEEENGGGGGGGGAGGDGVEGGRGEGASGGGERMMKIAQEQQQILYTHYSKCVKSQCMCVHMSCLVVYKKKETS